MKYILEHTSANTTQHARHPCQCLAVGHSAMHVSLVRRREETTAPISGQDAEIDRLQC